MRWRTSKKSELNQMPTSKVDAAVKVHVGRTLPFAASNPMFSEAQLLSTSSSEPTGSAVLRRPAPPLARRKPMPPLARRPDPLAPPKRQPVPPPPRRPVPKPIVSMQTSFAKPTQNRVRTPGSGAVASTPDSEGAMMVTRNVSVASNNSDSTTNRNNIIPVESESHRSARFVQSQSTRHSGVSCERSVLRVQSAADIEHAHSQKAIQPQQFNTGASLSTQMSGAVQRVSLRSSISLPGPGVIAHQTQSHVESTALSAPSVDLPADLCCPAEDTLATISPRRAFNPTGSGPSKFVHSVSMRFCVSPNLLGEAVSPKALGRDSHTLCSHNNVSVDDVDSDGHRQSSAQSSFGRDALVPIARMAQLEASSSKIATPNRCDTLERGGSFDDHRPGGSAVARVAGLLPSETLVTEKITLRHVGDHSPVQSAVAFTAITGRITTYQPANYGLYRGITMDTHDHGKPDQQNSVGPSRTAGTPSHVANVMWMRRGNRMPLLQNRRKHDGTGSASYPAFH